jgi:hypothetical protein
VAGILAGQKDHIVPSDTLREKRRREHKAPVSVEVRAH